MSSISTVLVESEEVLCDYEALVSLLYCTSYSSFLSRRLYRCLLWIGDLLEIYYGLEIS